MDVDEWKFKKYLEQYTPERQLEINGDSNYKVVYKYVPCSIDKNLSEKERPKINRDRVYSLVKVKKYCIIMDKLGESLFNINELFLNKLSL